MLRDARGALDPAGSPPGGGTSGAGSPGLQRVGWAPALGVVGSWITYAPGEPEVKGGRALVQGCLQGWRLPAVWQVPLVVPVLCRGAGTSEGTIAVSTSRTSWSLARERGWGSTGSIAWHPQPLCARALCHVSLAPVFL